MHCWVLCNLCVRLLCAEAFLAVSAHHSSFFFFLLPVQTQDVTPVWSTQPHKGHDYIVMACDLYKQTASICVFVHTPLLIKESAVPFTTFQSDTATLKVLSASKLYIKSVRCFFPACTTLPKCRTFHYLDQLSFHWCLFVVFGKLVGLSAGLHKKC